MIRKIYLTGATGVLGAEVETRLPSSQFQIIPVTRQARDGRPPASLFDPSTWFSPADKDADLVHLAGISDPRISAEDTEEFHQEHTAPHFQMVESLLDMGWKGRLIIASSGGCVYGEPKQLPIPENHALSPLSLYGQHKALIESGLAKLLPFEQGRLFILRIANLYGTQKTKSFQGVLPILSQHLQAGKEFTIFGDGSETRDYIHAKDVVSAIQRALTVDPKSAGVYNIGSSQGTSLNDLIEAMEKATGLRLKKRLGEGGTNVNANVLDNSLAKQGLDWTPSSNIIEDILAGDI